MTADENVKVTYTVSQEGKNYLTGGDTLKLKKANDTAKSMWIDVTLKLSDQNAAYTKRIKVMLPVSEEKRTELMDTIAADYTDSSDLWTIMDMAAYGTLSGKDHKTTEDAKQNALNTGITTAAKENASVSDRAKLEITLRSMGIDTTKLYKANDVKRVNNAGRLAAMDVTSAAITAHHGFFLQICRAM